MKSIYRKAAETLVNRSLPESYDYSCYHLYHHVKDGFSILPMRYISLFCPGPASLTKPHPWWGEKRKTPKQLLAASLALLLIEQIDE